MQSHVSFPPALVVAPGPRAAWADDSAARELTAAQARRALESGPVLVAHAGLTARRAGLAAPPRSPELYDALELFAFVRPAQFCAPSAIGLAQALGLAEPVHLIDQAAALRDACARLLDELAALPTAAREEALSAAETLLRFRWAWAERALAALRSRPAREGPRGAGLAVWTRLAEWEDAAPAGEPRSAPVTAEAARRRLSELLDRAGLDEARPAQADFAAEAAYAFTPRAEEGSPRLMLAEAGTGVGKTLGYLAPASLWAEANGPSVWVSTYTRALQRQIAREAAGLWPDPAERARKAVVRKGRENYLCLLNFQELAQAALQGGGVDPIGVVLVARWILHTRDGDMTGGDFPAWLPTLFAVSGPAQASAANLVDRRGECVHAACPHYRTCFVEKSIRAGRRADIVVANHALVLSQAAFDGARAARGLKPDGETSQLKRIVFDEGHHLFDAADSAFSACLSGQETAELRRWIRGPEGRRRGRGLDQRLSDLVGSDETASRALADVIRAAAALPADGWSGRVAPPRNPQEAQGGFWGEPQPSGPVETFLAAAHRQLRARSAMDEQGGQCAVQPVEPYVAEAAQAAARALAAIEAPLLALARALEDLLDDETDQLETGDRARIEGALRGLDRRARLTLPAWRAMLHGLSRPEVLPPRGAGEDRRDPGLHPVASEGGESAVETTAIPLPPSPASPVLPPQAGGEPTSAQAGPSLYVDWFEAVPGGHRAVADVAYRRHFVDPSEPLAAAVLGPAHGVLIASATLADPLGEHPFALAEARTGALRLPGAPKLLRLTSPFDFAGQARAIVVTDVNRNDPRQVAAAMRELFLSAGGGALGLFTAIRRLRIVYEHMAGPLAEQGLALYAQHVDPLEVGALIDVFRAEEHSCLLGTDAVRDGVDVPGRALRLLVFDRVPWPRPDLLHQARRARFGARTYDDALARARIAQAFGRLIRRADDKGVFVMLDAAAPTRLFASLPDGVTVQRMGLVEAIETTAEFLRVEGLGSRKKTMAALTAGRPSPCPSTLDPRP